ncbi:glycosyltransferase [Synechococcus sp. CS-1325]|uniref:glycosyltransferase n=1 Tax=unclassified Synechococcus TaxID=2626047 RepID=UPI0021A50A06|nr:MULTISPECIES: glycosyltransferase [unclassified Synechococcus]MCT0199208.1 glycosyltransferase [Synechococcus sp. CS-1325]MCT0214613.1 glycosyltransferase [Synechococcus sp. CS-1326]
MVPLDTSSGGTIVCREHLRSISSTSGTQTHVFAPPGPLIGGSADYAKAVGAFFHPLEFQHNRRFFPDLPLIFSHPFSMERHAALHRPVDHHFSKIVRDIRPDVIIIDYLFTSLYVPSAFHCGVPVVMITLNREKEFYRDQRKLGVIPSQASNSRIAEWRLGRFENEVHANSDHIVVLSPHDIPTDCKQAARTTVIEPMLDNHPKRWCNEEQGNVFFVGNVNHYPNLCAVRWLCESLAPHLAACAPELRITIIGAEPLEAPETWKQPNVVLLGRSTADEVLRQFTACGIFIAPIENSFGSKIKILEALSHATPLVATAEALTGVPGSTGIPLFTLDDPKGAAELITGIIRSPGNLEDLSRLMDEIRDSNLDRSRTAWPMLIQSAISKGVMPRQIQAWSLLRFQKAPAGGKKKIIRTRHKNQVIDVNNISSHWIRSQGLGPLEQFEGCPLRWTADLATLTIRIDPVNPPSWLRVCAWNITPIEGSNLKVFANDVNVLSGAINHRTFDRVVPLSQLMGQCELTLRFESEGYQIPGDDRILGVALKSVLLGSSWHNLKAHSFRFPRLPRIVGTLKGMFRS